MVSISRIFNDITNISQNFCLFLVSNLSVLNFRIFLLMYPGSLSQVSDRHDEQSAVSAETGAAPPPTDNGDRCIGSGTVHSPSRAAALRVDRSAAGRRPGTGSVVVKKTRDTGPDLTGTSCPRPLRKLFDSRPRASLSICSRLPLV